MNALYKGDTVKSYFSFVYLDDEEDTSEEYVRSETFSKIITVENCVELTNLSSFWCDLRMLDLCEEFVQENMSRSIFEKIIHDRNAPTILKDVIESYTAALFNPVCNSCLNAIPKFHSNSRKNSSDDKFLNYQVFSKTEFQNIKFSNNDTEFCIVSADTFPGEFSEHEQKTLAIHDYYSYKFTDTLLNFNSTSKLSFEITAPNKTSPSVQDFEECFSRIMVGVISVEEINDYESISSGSHSMDPAFSKLTEYLTYCPVVDSPRKFNGFWLSKKESNINRDFSAMYTGTNQRNSEQSKVES